MAITTFFTNPSLGYVNNPKGIATTYDATFGAITYAVDILNSPTGAQLFIKTYYGKNQELLPGAILAPNIPYRIFLNDPSFVSNKLGSYLAQYPTNGTNIILNPGFTNTNGTIGLPSAFSSGSTKYIELNILRDSTAAFIKNNTTMQDANGRLWPFYFTDFKVTDSQASVIVKKDTVNPELYDWLYLSVVARVDITGYDVGVIKHYFWALPLVMQFKITKAQLSSPIIFINPNSWSYAVNSKYTSSTNKITNIADNGFAQDSWNYKLIPGYWSNEYFKTVSYGCLIDTSFVSANTVVSHSSIGMSDAPSDDNPLRQIDSVVKIEFVDNTFVKPSITTITETPVKHSIANYISCAICGSYYVTLRCAYSADSTIPNGTMSLCILNSLIRVVSYISIKGAGNGSLCVDDTGVLYLKYTDSTNTFRVYKFPTINASLITNLGIKMGISPSQAETLFNTYLTLKWKAQDTLSAPSIPIILTNLTSAKAEYAIQDYTQDTSLFETLDQLKGNGAYIEFDNSELLLHYYHTGKHWLHSYKYKQDTSTAIEDVADVTKGVLHSIYNDGLSLNNQVIANVIYSDTFTRDYKVYNYGAATMSLGGASVEYWVDPVFGTDVYTDTPEQDRSGIKLMINISGCSGIYSSAPLTTDSFSTSIIPKMSDAEDGGVLIDTARRPDLDFIYGGNKASFLSLYSTWRGGYFAIIKTPCLVSFTNPDGQNLIYGSTGKKAINCTVWHYDETGMFNMYVPLSLDLSNAGADLPFTDPNFTLSGCILNVETKGRNGSVLAKKQFTININPPDANGSITSVGNIYKTASVSGEFALVRQASNNASDYTELWNVSKHSKNAETGAHIETEPYSYKEDNVVSSKIIRITNDLPRGSYYWISYEPKLHGIKPGVSENNGIATTNYVTNCKGNRFYLENTQLQLGVSGVYNANILSNVQRSSPYLHVAIDNSIDIKVITDIEHEDWSMNDGSSFRNSYPENQIYPGISGIYLALVEKTSRFMNYYTESKFSSYDYALTYPNVDIDNDLIKKIWLGQTNILGVTATGIYLSGTDIELTAREMHIAVSKSSNYRVFLSVEDEFEQFSTWCITNPTTFNFPFQE